MSESTSIPIFYGDVPRSVRAAMLFPADQEKARVFAGWVIAGSLQSSTDRSKDDLVSIAQDAAAFTKIKEEVGQREYAGQAAGEVIKTLFAMIGTDRDRHVASIDSAIDAVENIVVSAGQGTSRKDLRAHVSLLRPALHLWGAWSLRGRRWPSSISEADLFMGEAEIFRRELVGWNLTRKGSRSEHLGGYFLQPYDGWHPRDVKLQAISLRPDDVPIRRRAGRPKSRPVKTG